jgi:hypothetical protein
MFLFSLLLPATKDMSFFYRALLNFASKQAKGLLAQWQSIAEF